MDPKQLEAFQKSVEQAIDGIVESKLKTIVGETAAFEARKVVETLRVERLMFGKDRTGLSEDSKKDFVAQVKAIARGEKEAAMRVKANEALIEEQDSRGGYLVPKEVASAIVRIAASVGFVMSHAAKWDVKTDELQIPAYTGSVLTGEYLGVDAAGTVTALSFDQARLIVKKWQLAFVVANDLLADAPVQLADWLLALGGESLANMIDKQGLAGTGAPFVGILNDANVNVHTMTTGKDTFAEFDLDEASDIIASLEESVLDGAVFVFEKTVWAKIRIKKDTAGNYVLPQAGAPSAALLANYVGVIGGAKPVGEIMGYPVFTNRHLPANSATAVSTKFGIFGNFSAQAYGDKGDLRVAQFGSGSFGGKEIALADQTALVYKHRHGIVTTLPKAFTAIKTAAS
jgi:HK97 family phage major capsid protein